MILLTKHSLTQANVFSVETESLTLAEKDSQVTFTMALPGGPGSSAAPLNKAPTLTVGDWLMEDSEPGKGTVWVVKSIEYDYTKKIRTVTAEHVINILKNAAMWGEITPEDMGGSETSCTALQAVTYVLNRSNDWTLGGVGYSVSAGYTFNSDSLFEALVSVSSTLDDCWWSYDLSVYPFRLYINPKDTTAACEMRMSRNITSIKRSIDASQLYTRIFPIGKDDLHITGNYLSKNTSTYGIIHKIETNQAIDSEPKLRAWAQQRLNNHAQPNVTITVNGLELSEMTGETLDRIRPGMMCQAPLPEFSTVITETVKKMVWKDKLKEPQNVTVTMANEAVDLATIIKQQNEVNTGGGGSGGRAAAKAGKKKKEEDHAWMVDTTDHIGLVAEAVAGEGADQDWSKVASVMVDGEGVHQRLVTTQNDMVVAETRLDVLDGAIVQKVTKGDVATQLAVECGNVSITGGNLTVDGYVTADGLDAVIATLDVVHVKSIQAADGTNNANLSLHSVTAQSSLYVGTGQSSVELIGSGITDAVTDLQFAHTAGTATYTLQKKTIASHSSWTDVGSFSKAAALSGAYGGDNTGITATYTVTGTPAENFPGGNTAAGSFVVKQNKNAAWIEDPNGTIRARVNNPQYGNGWAAAYAEVDLPITSSTADNFSVKTPKSTTDGGADTETYTMSSATNDIAVVKNLGGTVVARLEHGKYTAGFTAGNANRASQVLGLYTSAETPVQTLAAGSTYEIVTQYQQYDGTWATGGSIVVATSAGSAGTVTVDFQAAVASNAVRAGRTTDPIEIYSKQDGTTVVTTNVRLMSGTYSPSSGVTNQCIDLRVGTGSTGRIIGRINIQPVWNAGYVAGHEQGVIDGKASVTPESHFNTFTLTRGSYDSHSQTYTWNGILSQSQTGSKTRLDVWY